MQMKSEILCQIIDIFIAIKWASAVWHILNIFTMKRMQSWLVLFKAIKILSQKWYMENRKDNKNIKFNLVVVF